LFGTRRVVNLRGGDAVSLEDVQDFGFRKVEAEGFESDFEFVVVDVGVFV